MKHNSPEVNLSVQFDGSVDWFLLAISINSLFAGSYDFFVVSRVLSYQLRPHFELRIPRLLDRLDGEKRREVVVVRKGEWLRHGWP